MSRFKGLGEMMPAQLKETTMRPGHRTLLQVHIPEDDVKETENLFERLMGKKPELRFQFIQENAEFAAEVGRRLARRYRRSFAASTVLIAVL